MSTPCPPSSSKDSESEDKDVESEDIDEDVVERGEEDREEVCESAGDDINSCLFLLTGEVIGEETLEKGFLGEVTGEVKGELSENWSFVSLLISALF
mmetsp:Transcript_12686/g.15188  ORF Transcript_12686/g.15188 Transcript_12686/m.15188 type:complete len:97 (+) Transcript_12686:356-646(+)